MQKPIRRSSICALVLFAAAGAFGQQSPAPSPTSAPIDADDGKDDILLIVKVQAKELKMDIVPNSTVTFPGTHERTTLWLTERKNLPDKLEPGVTYRDIGITLRISSRFENIDQIVREALGETAPAPEPAKEPAATAVAASTPPVAEVAVRKPRKTSRARSRRH